VFPPFGHETESIDMRASMQNPRRSFEVLRWMSVAALVALPFAFMTKERMSAFQIIAAVVFAVLWLAMILLTWRLRSNRLLALQFSAFLLAPGFLGIFRSSSVGPGVSPVTFQWLAIVIVLAGLPLLVARNYFLKLADLSHFPAPFGAEDRQ
jgi:hypothetical protein